MEGRTSTASDGFSWLRKTTTPNVNGLGPDAPGGPVLAGSLPLLPGPHNRHIRLLYDRAGAQASLLLDGAIGLPPQEKGQRIRRRSPSDVQHSATFWR